jgi:hypothetical protein
MVEEELDILVYWIRERDAIRIRRLKSPTPPWTEDQLLREYRWCNVRRMDDKVSRWLLEWHQQHPEIGIKNRVTAALAGRLINWPPTLAALPYPAPYDEEEWSRILELRNRSGAKVFTGAYIINGALRGPKIFQITQKILLPFWQDRRSVPGGGKSMREIWAYMNGRPGIGSFMAGQAAADLRHIHHELPWEDRYTWAPEGPGSLRGANRLIGRHPDASWKSDDWLEVVRAAYARCAARLPRTFARLELMDLQNCLCEYDKYRRLTLGEGSVRSRYAFKGNDQFAHQEIDQ